MPTDADTYYTPDGSEHLRQEPVADAVTDTVAARVLKGDHVHTWSKDQGARCFHADGTYEEVPRLEPCTRDRETDK